MTNIGTVGGAYRSIALTLIITFALSFGYLYRKQTTPHAAGIPPPPIETSHEVNPSPAPRAARTEASAEFAPVAIRIRNGHRENRVEGNITSLSEDPLTVTIVGRNNQGYETARATLLLTPKETKSFGTDEGMELQSGDIVVVQSPGYRDRQAGAR